MNRPGAADRAYRRGVRNLRRQSKLERWTGWASVWRLIVGTIAVAVSIVLLVVR